MSVVRNIKTLLRYRPLLSLWLRYEIRARYTQTLLGIIWIILLPFLEAMVLAYIFSTFAGGPMTKSGAPFFVFIFSGRVFYSIFDQTVSKAKSAIVGKMELIKQIYFPREILLFLIIGETLVDFCFLMVALLIINAGYHIFPTYYYLYLPLPIIIMTGLSLGTALIVSWLGLMIRDMQQIIGITLRLLFYATVLFAPSRIGAEMTFWDFFNPLLALTEFFRMITIYDQAPDFRLLVVPTVLAVIALLIGYRSFKKREELFGDYT